MTDNGFEVEMVNHQKLNETINESLKLVDISIKDAQSNKKTLASKLPMVISLMKEVECKEKAAEQAKEEAAASGLHILAKVDELKQSRNRAKETNDMRYREMYAQKEVLASELKELLFRMSGMLNKGGESLEVLDQMRIALEERLASAITDKDFADTEKLQKELCAQEALTNEVNQMQKFEEESKRLNQHAAKISKLQEYLIGCSHVVNTLRADESDECEHVNLLKKLLDLKVPLNEILSSSQTSSILAPIKSHHEPQPKTLHSNESADSLVLSDVAVTPPSPPPPPPPPQESQRCHTTIIPPRPPRRFHSTIIPPRPPRRSHSTITPARPPRRFHSTVIRTPPPRRFHSTIIRTPTPRRFHSTIIPPPPSRRCHTTIISRGSRISD